MNVQVVVVVVVLLTSAAAAAAAAAFGTVDSATATTGAIGTLYNHKAERVELAIQDLYAELKTIDSAAGADSVKGAAAAAVTGIHLDDALSVKAKYVADSLRSMANGGAYGAGGKAAAVADDTIEQKLRRKQKEVIDALGPYNDDNGRTAILVDRLMNRCVEIALAGKDEIEQPDGGDAKAKAADNAKAAEKTGGGPVAARVDVDAVERSFLDVLQQLERLKIKPPGSSSTIAAVLRRRHNDAAVPLSSSPSPHRVANGLFKFGLFNRQRSLSAVADDAAGVQ